MIGAIGGLLLAGVIGLFVGAVVLAIGYNLFTAWVGVRSPPDVQEGEAAPGTE
jgi:predicted PurR-regulated permease PerM